MLRITVFLQEYDFPTKSTFNLAQSHLSIHIFLYYISAYFCTEQQKCISKNATRDSKIKVTCWLP